MPFAYKLETLLRLQRAVEHQEENRLLAGSAAVAGIQTRLVAMEELHAERARCTQQELAEAAPGIVLQLFAEWKIKWQQARRVLRKELELAEKERQRQVAVYREARQKREVLEGLKEKKESVYTTEELRRLQRVMDETFLMQTFYRNRG